MGVLRPFDPRDHGRAAPDLVQLRDLTRARWPDAEFGSSGTKPHNWGEITLHFPTARPKPITIYAAPPGGYRRRRANTWRLEILHGGNVLPREPTRSLHADCGSG